MTWTLRVENISYSYETDKPVLENCSATFESGNIYSILGENGKGKTTFLELITNNLLPSQGSIRYYKNGQIASYPNNSIGYMSSDFDIYQRLTVRQMTQLVLSLRRIPKNIFDEVALRYSQDLKLEQYQDYPVESLSTGTKARFHLFLSILHDPDIVILDEPTNGLDPKQFSIFEIILDRLKCQNKLIILSTHSLLLSAQTATNTLLLDNQKLQTMQASNLRDLEKIFAQ